MHVAIGHLKKVKFRTKISHMSIFDVSVFLRGYLLTSCDIFEKVLNIVTLEEMVLKKFQVVLQNFAIIYLTHFAAKGRKGLFVIF